MNRALPARHRLTAAAVTLGAGLLGGTVLYLLDAPMPWLLGSILGAAAAAMRGLPSGLPRWLRDGVLVVLGLMIGATIHRSTLAHIARWPISMAAVVLYVALCTAGAYAALRRFAHFDPVTAYFSAAPGGFLAMAVVGRTFGGRERDIALTHSVRVVLVVFGVVLGYHLFAHPGAAPAPPPAAAPTAHAWAVLVVLGAVGWPLGRLLRLPSSAMLGPLLLTAVAQVAGWTSAPAMPTGPLLFAELVLGSGIGADFAGTTFSELARAAGISVLATAGMLALSALFALALRPLTGVPLQALFLAFTPGGLSGISLIALALGIDPAFVTAHNVLRVLVIVLAGPLVFRLAAGRR